MKNLYESLLDIDDSTLDLLNDDLMDMFNSKSEDEWNKRWDMLNLKLKNTGEIAPKNAAGFLQSKKGRLYIRPFIFDKVFKTIHLGKDNNGYIMQWNKKIGKVVMLQNRYLNYRCYSLISSEYMEYPLYILPNDLKKIYRELIKIA